MLKYVKNKHKDWIYDLRIDSKEFTLFINKLKGSLIFRGAKSRSVKIFDDLLFNIKKKFKKDPISILFKVTKNLLPLFATGYRRMGNKYQAIPKLALGNNRNVLMIDWLIRALKNISNVRGVKIEDISKVIIDTYYGKGKAMISKKAYYKRALSGKHFLERSRNIVEDRFYRNRLIKRKKKYFLFKKNNKKKYKIKSGRRKN